MFKSKTMTSKNNLKHWFKNFTKRELLIIWLLVLLFIGLDVWGRFNSSHVQKGNDWSPSELTTATLLTLNAEEFAQLSEKLKRFESPAEATGPKQQGLTEAEMQAQNGDLKELYAKNMRLTLVGVFEQDGRFAVIAQDNLTTNKRELLRVTSKDMLNGYTVKNILPNKLIFTGYNNVINLHLYNTNS